MDFVILMKTKQRCTAPTYKLSFLGKNGVCLRNFQGIFQKGLTFTLGEMIEFR